MMMMMMNDDDDDDDDDDDGCGAGGGDNLSSLFNDPSTTFFLFSSKVNGVGEVVWKSEKGSELKVYGTREKKRREAEYLRWRELGKMEKNLR